MKITRHYFKMGSNYNDHWDWGHLCIQASKQGIPLYKDKETNEMYSYHSFENLKVEIKGQEQEIIPLRVEEVEIEPKVTKIPSKKRRRK